MLSKGNELGESILNNLAKIIPKFLTNKDTETFVSFIHSFQERIERVNSDDTEAVALEFSSKHSKENPILCNHEGKTCTQNCTRSFIKTFTTSFTLKYLLEILPFILTGKIIKRPNMLMKIAGSDTIKFALFLSVFISSYKKILCALRHYRKNKKSDRLNAFIAGSLSGLALGLDSNKERRQAVMIYLFTKSLQFSCGWLMNQWALKREKNHPGEKKWDDHLDYYLKKYSGIGIMMIASAQLFYAFMFNNDTVPKSYTSFLLTHASFKTNYKGLARASINAYGDIIQNVVDKNKAASLIPQGITSREIISRFVDSKIVDFIPASLHHGHLGCVIQHPSNESCIIDKIYYFKHQYARSLKLYMPFNLIMLVLFKLKKLANDPINVMQKLTISSLRSSLFLTMYSITALITPCVLRYVTGTDTHLFYVISGLTAGSMLAIETTGRQLELGLYLFTRTLESSWKLMIKKGHVKNIPNGEIALFMLSMGTIMTLYQNDKHVISPNYLSIMTKFFGNN